MLEFINAVLPVIITGLFGVIMWKLQTAENTRKENRQKQDERMERIEVKLEENENVIQELKEKSEEMNGNYSVLIEKVDDIVKKTEINASANRVTLRHMLQRYHAEYTLQGFVTSAQKKDFLETYNAYKNEGSHETDTGKGYKATVEMLPVRDDLPVVNPFIELIKYLNILKKCNCEILKEAEENEDLRTI